MTERENHLMFCKYCSNSSNNLRHGIICSLTKRPADFDNECTDYSESLEFINKETKSLELRIDEKYDNVRDIFSYILENIFGIYFFDSIFKTKYNLIRREQTHKLKIENSSQSIKLYIIGFSFLTLLFLIYMIFNYKRIWLIFSVIMFCFVILYLLMLKLRRPRIEFKTDQEGFYYKDKKIKWNEILVYKSVTTEHKYSFKRVAIGTKSRGIIEINISNLDIGIKDFFKIIELNKNVA